MLTRSTYKKIGLIFLLISILFSCIKKEDTILIGVAMPTKSSPRWISDGNFVKAGLEDLAYKVDLQYAEDIIENQIAQIENMITKGVKLLIIASIDGSALTNVIEKAHEQGIGIIAYDRLIRNSPNVDYYVTFDNFEVGVLMGQSLLEGLEQLNKPSYNIELFGGSPDDNNAYFFYDGAMSVLDPLINSNKLRIRSGQEGMNIVSTLRWDGATAQARMDNILTAYYTDATLDGVLSPFDGISIGIISSLKSVGYGAESLIMPIITGQDAEIPSVKAIIAGDQYSTIFKDTRSLAKVAISMVQEILTNQTVSANDIESYDNGEKVVPSYLLKPLLIKENDIQKDLIDSGYYQKSELGL